jgi:DNA-binding LacI/PurR family transcriptional regulator
LPGNRVTSFDVARLAGVSQSAVSRAFTPGASVRPETRDKVLQAAGTLGYAPNALARSLITGRSRIIGLVVSHLDNLFYPAVLDSLCRRLQREGLHLLMFVGEGPDSDGLVGKLLQYHVDGIVLGSVTLSSALAQRCVDARIPVVLFNRVMRRRAGQAQVGSVRSDNARGAEALADHLIGLGHRRIAFIAGHEESSTNLERERGFISALRRAGTRLFARVAGHYDPDRAAEATRALFGRADRRPDAVFAASDQMAIAAIDTLRHAVGLRVPEDISVVGFDGVPQGAWPGYGLTTFEQPLDAMVEATVSLLLDQITRGALAPRNLVIPGRLIVRSSTTLRSRPRASRGLNASGRST